MTRLNAGSEVINNFLEGGFESGVITTIYGPAASGKTNLCMLFAVANTNKKVLWVDTEGGFSVERFKQLCPDYEEVLKNILFLKPVKFSEQVKVIKDLETYKGDISTIIVDSITMLYRASLADEDMKSLNDLLVKQFRSLLEIARKRDIPVLVTAQVGADLDEKDRVKVVGGSIVRNISKCMIELQKENGERVALLIKHRSLPEQKVARFKIVQKGIEELK